jgi:hypothetical protein
MLTLIYRVLGYANLLVWGILLYAIICWHFNLQGFDKLKNIGDDIAKKVKFEKILKVLNYILYFLVFFLIISSWDILFMTIGIFDPARLPYKGMILASDVSLYFLFLFVRYLFESAVHHTDN